jgi:ABC-type nitrate/sulfonate/bicarbonate transport system permease component
MAENCGAEILPPSMIATAQNGVSPSPIRFRRLRLSRVKQMQLVSVLALLGGWWAISTQTTPLTLPGPIPVLVALVCLLFSWEFWLSLLVSLQSLALGYTVSVVIGLVGGVGFGLLSRRAGAIFDAYLIIGLSVPITGLIPVVVMILGIGLAARVMVVVLFAVFQIAINVVTGVRESDRSLVEMAHSFGASPSRVFWRIILPDAVPSIMAGMRLGLGRAIVGMVTSELILLSVGVGRMVVKFSSSFQTANLLAYLTLIVAFGVLLMAAVQRLERRFTRWYK